MRINIIYNHNKDNCYEIALKSAEILKQSGAHVSIFDIDAATSNNNEETVFKTAEIIAVVGGDGTILKIAKIAALNNKAIVGINAGRLGYLACIGADQLNSLKFLVNGDYTIENRTMILAEWYENNTLLGKCNCLNDAVISHGAISTLIDLDIAIDNDNFFYRADGIIAATPSGSTAYSLSAGGPVVDPTLDCFILTPVCPHTLQNRALVINSTKTADIKVDCSKNASAYLSCDGENVYEIKRSSTIKIKRSDLNAKFIKLNDVSVYKVFSEKTKII